MTKLAACPFCGRTEFVRTVSTHEEEDLFCEHDETFAVCCDASYDAYPVPEGVRTGCGAHSGYHETMAEAITNWNRSATPWLAKRNWHFNDEY